MCLFCSGAHALQHQALRKLSGSMQQARARRDSDLKKLECGAVLILTHTSLEGAGLRLPVWLPCRLLKDAQKQIQSCREDCTSDAKHLISRSALRADNH